MLKLVRGLNLTIDPEKNYRLLYGASNSLQLNLYTLTLWVTLAGKVDHESGFIVNVCEIDDAIEQALNDETVIAKTGNDILRWTRKVLKQQFPDHEVFELKLDLNEQLSLFERCEQLDMIQVTQKYEMAAAHRLHNPNWNSEKNIQVFGKCNNPDGHGHNYTVEVTLGGKSDSESGQLIDLDEMDRVVKENILDRFDHRNLNTEIPEFSELNPTVENMCRVFWDILTGQFGEVKLMKVGIWETPKTYAEYTGPLDGPLRMSDVI